MQGLELKDLALRWSSCTRIWALTKKGFCNSLSHTTFITKIIDFQCLQKELWDMEQTGQERSSHLTLTTTEITADKLSWITTEIKPFSSRFNNNSWSCQIHLCQEYSLYKKKVTCTNPITSEHEIDELTNSAICMIGEQTHQLPSKTHREKNAYIYIYMKLQRILDNKKLR
jgi:ubiquitin-protein ligase